jgi:hypothetical protein
MPLIVARSHFCLLGVLFAIDYNVNTFISVVVYVFAVLGSYGFARG